MGVNVLNGFNDEAKAFIYVTEEENEIINGNVFKFSLDGDLTVSGGATPYIDIGLVTGDLDIRLNTAFLEGDANYVEMSKYEGVPFTGSTEITPINANRQSSNTSSVTVYSDFTVDPAADLSAYTRIGRLQAIGADTVGGRNSGGSGTSCEFCLLKRNTQYVIRIRNTDASNAAHFFFKESWISTNLTD